MSSPALRKLDVQELFTTLGGQLTLVRGVMNPSEEGLWLAASLRPTPRQSVLDAGCGSGIVGLSLLKQEPTLQLTGVDCHPMVVQQAQVNAALNGLPYQTFEGCFTARLFDQRFDHVVANLPFHAANRGFETDNPHKKRAYCLPEGVLELWLESLWAHTQQRLHVLLHIAEEAETVAWLRAQGVPYWCRYLVSHPLRGPKRVIFHIGEAGTAQEVTTYCPDLRRAVLYEGRKL